MEKSTAHSKAVFSLVIILLIIIISLSHTTGQLTSVVAYLFIWPATATTLIPSDIILIYYEQGCESNAFACFFFFLH